LNLSASPQADRERTFIRRQIAAGKTKGQIEDELVAQYGTRVLAEPPKSGFDLTAWLVPGAAILLAAVAIALGLWRWRRAARGGAAGPRIPAAPAGRSSRASPCRGASGGRWSDRAPGERRMGGGRSPRGREARAARTWDVRSPCFVRCSRRSGGACSDSRGR